MGTTLVKHNYITEKQLIDTLRIQLGIEYIDLSKVDITPEMSRYVPKNLAKKMNVVPVRVSRDQLFLAMADPLNFMAIEEAKRTSKKRIVPMIRLVNSIIERAVSVNASDIHFEPTEDNMVIRMRIDGQLQQVSYMEGKLKN
ncbi:hypothetical protein DWZ86_05630 [Clostridiales bacterium AF36-10]|nr:hypothetical protein DXC33_07475 [Clostridiaceae bacterium TF01-6]RJW88247.1 hypothetical protein DWZ86_05630 [Clostridiales bacterium AF36-10]